MQGTFIIIDGMDGSGKSVVLDAMKDEAKSQGYKLLDLHDYWQKHNKHPSINDLDVDIIFSSEPTYIFAGALIRNELIRNGTSYSAITIAQAYALDRHMLYEQLLVPGRKKGIHIIQSRSVSTSLIYQPIDAKRKGEQITQDTIKSLPGNAYALSHNPDALVLLILDPKEAMNRLALRKKQDDASFEQLEFQEQVRQSFIDPAFKKIYEVVGTKVLYPDVSISIDHTKKQAKDIFNRFIRRLL